MRAQEFVTEAAISLSPTSQKARAWIQMVYDRYPQTWQNNHVMPIGPEQFAMFELTPSLSQRDAVEVKWFQAYPLRQGVGSRAMQELQALAREHDISLTLFPWDKGQVSQAKLTKFYRGQGFSPTVKGGKAMAWSPDQPGVLEGKHPGKSVVDAIQKVLPLTQEIWFHGSRATGKHRRNSDTDILVVVPDDLVGDQYLAVVRILQKLSSIFDNYDIQPTKAGNNIHRIAQEEGQLLWSNKPGVSESAGIQPSAAGCVLVAADTGRWCLQQRSNTVSDPGVWSTWGGGSEPGESVTETVLRELAEESGYTGPVTLRLVDSSPSYATFMAVVPHEFEPELNSECQDWQWCEPDQLPRPLHPGLTQTLSKNFGISNNVVSKQGVAEDATVTRIDSKPIADFSSGLKAYKHTDDWSQSGIDTGDDSYWKNKNLKTNTTKGLFAGDPRRTALYATGNAHETRYVEFTQNGQPIVYFDKKDLPAMRSRKTYLTVFDASNFRQLPTGEWFSENPGKPIKQTPIGDPFKYIADQGWIVRVTNDLDKVFNQVKKMHNAGKIAQYGAEGMNESQLGVAENFADDKVNEDSFTNNFSQIDSIITKQYPKKIMNLLLGMFPTAKEAIVYQYNDEDGMPFSEWRRAIYEIDNYILSGPVVVDGAKLPINPEIEADRLAKYQQYIKDKDSGQPARYFRANDSDPRTIDFTKLSPITIAQTDRGMEVADGNHRAFLAKMANKPLRAVVWTKQKNNHPNVAKIKSLFQEINENFADGKKPGRKGLSKRVGIPQKASLSQLQKIASNSTGERRRMAQWQLNMRRGKAKKNK